MLWVWSLLRVNEYVFNIFSFPRSKTKRGLFRRSTRYVSNLAETRSIVSLNWVFSPYRAKGEKIELNSHYSLILYYFIHQYFVSRSVLLRVRSTATITHLNDDDDEVIVSLRIPNCCLAELPREGLEKGQRNSSIRQ